MLKKNTLKNILICLVFGIAMFCAFPSTIKAARKNAEHTVYADSVVESRLSTIRDYYYNKPSLLTQKNMSGTIFSSWGDKVNMTYYLHGSDLMFGYGTIGKTELRLYFLRGQLIELYVDEPGKTRNAYRQLYKNLPNFSFEESSEYAFYFSMEDMATTLLDQGRKTGKKRKNGECFVGITKITGTRVYFRNAYCYGPDGWVSVMGTKLYSIPCGKNLRVIDDSDLETPNASRNRDWIKSRIRNGAYGMLCNVKIESGVVSEIYCPYFA